MLTEAQEQEIREKVLLKLLDTERATTKTLREALKIVEWIAVDDSGAFCPRCKRLKSYGPEHNEGCELRAALGDAK